MSVLYISYDGMLEPLGQSQVLAYLKRLSIDRSIHLISFEKASDWSNSVERERLVREVRENGIFWHPLRYHKWPTSLATAWDIFCGTVLSLWLVIRYKLRVVHSRSYVPSLIGLVLKRLTGVRFIFDMRGFWADEKVDAGSWRKDSIIYRVTKWFERKFLLEADHLVSLTNAAVKIMQQFPYLKDQMPPFTVISTCADLTRFKPMLLKRENEGLTVGYVGTAGNWYLFDQTVACFVELLRKRPSTKFLIVNLYEQAYVKERLAKAGVPQEAYTVTSSYPAQMPNLIARMDASIFFIKPVFSKQASAATKLAELLGCGVPCLSNAGVGDMADILEGERVGVAINAFDEASLIAGLDRLLALVADPATNERCVSVAHKYFSLDEGVSRYREIYEFLE